MGFALEENIDLLVMDSSVIKSCHDLSTGGLLVSLAEMCFGGDLGALMDLSSLGDLRVDSKLFSESNGRWLLEVEEKDAGKLEGLDAIKVGETVKEKTVNLKDNKFNLSLDLEELREKWMSAVEREY